MPRGFVKNSFAHTTWYKRAAQATRLSFHIDRLLGRSEILPRGKSCSVWMHLNIEQACQLRGPWLIFLWHVATIKNDQLVLKIFIQFLFRATVMLETGLTRQQ